MSPVKRASTVDGLRRGVGHAKDPSIAPPPAAPAPTARTKPVRVTLNIPPDLYRELVRWADTAAVAIDVPRVGVQDALRAMVRGTLADTGATGVALGKLRQDRA